MATTDINSAHTLVELATRVHNNEVQDIMNVLAEMLPSMKDLKWREANGTLNHVHVQAIQLPSGDWRAANNGVDAETALTKAVTEPICRLEGRSEIDEWILATQRDKKKYRYEEDLLHLEGYAQTVESAFFYGNHATDPDRPDGLQVRYNTSSLDNVYNAGGTTASVQSSIYIVQHGLDAVHLVYPRGDANMGIQRVDKGLERVTSGNNSKDLYKWVTQFVFHIGVVIRDDRCVQRVANIGRAVTFGTVEDLMIEATINMPKQAKNSIIYVNKRIKKLMDVAAKDKTNVNYTVDNVWGVPTVHFRGTPVHLSESITDTEEVVT